jgi:hypothetical protein
MAIVERDVAIAVPKARFELFQSLKQKAPVQRTGAHLPGGQQLPGAKFRFTQLAVADAGWNCSAKPSMQ